MEGHWHAPASQGDEPGAEAGSERRFEERVRQEVGTLCDALGLPVDAGIAELVVAVRFHGFETTRSCEGHLDHGCPWPWVDIGPRKEDEDPATPLRALRPEVERLTQMLVTFAEHNPDLPQFVVYPEGRLQPVAVRIPGRLPVTREDLESWRRAAGMLAEWLLEQRVA